MTLVVPLLILNNIGDMIMYRKLIELLGEQILLNRALCIENTFAIKIINGRKL